MRCHYLSDLHLETQDFKERLPKGDVLIIAGDLCHAARLDPARADKYSVDQRDRVMRFIDTAQTNFAHVLLVPGNHDHYDGIFDTTVDVFRRFLPEDRPGDPRQFGCQRYDHNIWIRTGEHIAAFAGFSLISRGRSAESRRRLLKIGR